MKVEELKKKHDSMSKPIIKKYSAYLYYLMVDVLNLSKMEEDVETLGFTTNRVIEGGYGTLYTEILWEDKVVGHLLANVGWPSAEIDKRKRKFARTIATHERTIKPVKGWHRVLDWHTIRERKLHCLAGGQTVVYFEPVNITIERADEFINETGLGVMVEDLLKQEKEFAKEFNKK